MFTELPDWGGDDRTQIALQWCSGEHSQLGGAEIIQFAVEIWVGRYSIISTNPDIDCIIVNLLAKSAL